MTPNQPQNHIKNILPSGRSGGGSGGFGGSIALFGGTFDPIHNAHIALAEACREQLDLDEVWFMVTPQNPWKQGSTLSPDATRLRMAQLAVEGHEGLVASDYEFHLDKPTYTYLTLRHLREEYPQHQFTLLIGGDNWAAFDHWSHYEEILQHHAIAVYPREGSPIETPEALASMSFKLSTIHSPLLPISSTLVRQRVAEHKTVNDLVAPAVEQYITDHHLYQQNNH